MYMPNTLSDKFVNKYETMYGISKDLIGPRITPKLELINQLRQEQDKEDKKLQSKNIFDNLSSRTIKNAKSSRS